MDFTDITITNILASGTGFAVRNDDMTSVFISSKVAAQVTLNVGDNMRAILAPNHREPERTPWLAIRIEPRGPAQHPIAARILEDMQQGPATASEISESIGVPDGTVQLHLNALFEQGQLNREYLYDITAKGV